MFRFISIAAAVLALSLTTTSSAIELQADASIKIVQYGDSTIGIEIPNSSKINPSRTIVPIILRDRSGKAHRFVGNVMILDGKAVSFFIQLHGKTMAEAETYLDNLRGRWEVSFDF